MVINDSVRRNILSGFTLIYMTSGTLSIINPHINFNDNNVFNKFIKVDISTDNFIIPIIGLKSCENIIFKKSQKSSLNNYNFIDEIAIHLYANLETFARSGDSVLNKLFSTDFPSRLTKVTTTKGETYYGGRGIIFDGQMNPLIMLALQGNVSIDGNPNRIMYSKNICFVNPIVFTEDTLMNKFIIKKLIPVVANTNIVHSQRPFIDYPDSNSKAVVIIDNFDHFFVTPELSDIGNYSNEEANNLLVNFEDELINWK